MKKKVPFIIYSEATPNPMVMKFVSNKTLTNTAKECLDINDTTGWPLLNKVFSFPFVKELFINNNYISIKKHDTVEWEDVINQVRIFIQQELNNGIEISENIILDKENSFNKKSKMTLEIEKIINLNIKPAIQLDGGDIELLSYENLYSEGQAAGKTRIGKV